MSTVKLPQNEGEDFARQLDEALYREGQGSMVELAALLAKQGDLSDRQVYDALKSWRREVRPGQSFDLALRVAMAVPDLMREMARRSGYQLVPIPTADPKASAARAGKLLVEAPVDGAGGAQAAGEAARASGDALAAFWAAMEDGQVSAEELLAIRVAIRSAESRFARLEAQAQAAAARGAGDRVELVGGRVVGGGK